MEVFLATLPGVCILQLIHFARVRFTVSDFGGVSQFLTAGLLNKDHRYHKLRKAFSGFYHTYAEFVAECSVCFQNSSATRHIRSCIYRDLVYIFKIIVGKSNFSCSFQKDHQTL